MQQNEPKWKSPAAGLLAALCSLSLLAPLAQGAEIPPAQTFPILTPDPPQPKHSSLRLWLQEQGVSDLLRGWLVRLDYHTLVPFSPTQGAGITLDAHLQYMIGRSPVVLSQSVTKPEDQQSHFMEISAGAGYRFPLQNLSLTPQIRLRDLFAFSQVANQHLLGFEPGVRVEYWIYPEVTKLALDYGLTIPFAHLVNQPSRISPFSLSLHRLYLEMSYRLLSFLDLTAGFQLWQAPAELGSGTINNTVLANIMGFQLGAGWVF